MCTHLLFQPNIVLRPSLHALELRAHVGACCRGREGLRQGPRLVRVGDDSFGNGIGALAFPVGLELEGRKGDEVTILHSVSCYKSEAGRTLSKRCCQLPCDCVVMEDAPRAPRPEGLAKLFARGVLKPPRLAPRAFPRADVPNVAPGLDGPRGMAVLEPRPRALKAAGVVFEPLPRPRPRPADPQVGSMVVASAADDGFRHAWGVTSESSTPSESEARFGSTRRSFLCERSSSPRRMRCRLAGPSASASQASA